MWSNGQRAELARAHETTAALNDEKRQLEQRIAEIETACAAADAERAELRRAGEGNQSLFESIAHFGQSVGDIKGSFLGLVENLDHQNVAVTSAARSPAGGTGRADAIRLTTPDGLHANTGSQGL